MKKDIRWVKEYANEEYKRYSKVSVNNPRTEDRAIIWKEVVDVLEEVNEVDTEYLYNEIESVIILLELRGYISQNIGDILYGEITRVIKENV